MAMLAAAVPLLAGSSPMAKRPNVTYPIKSDVLPSLRGVPAPPSLRLEPREVPNRPTVRSAVPGESANLQTVPGAPNTPDPSAGWPGLVNNDNAAPQGDGLVEPPDTQGDVGTDYYIQWINSMFAVYDKTGTKVYPTAPATAVKGSILWAGFGGACQNDNDGDPITLWDPLAQRWVMSQFAVSTNYGSGPYYQCVAVSQTSNPMGAWNRYAFTWPSSHFPDYPKLGVWNDAYYISTNDFNAGLTSFVGVTAGAFDRTKMLAGDPAAGFVSFQLDPNIDYSMLPADFDGINPPPAGAPGLFGEFQDSTWTGLTNDQIWLYEFHVDWANPASSTFGVGASHTPNHQMDIANVSDQCTSRACVPMPPGGEGVDAIDFRTMYRLAYRNNTVGGEMMVTSMTVAGGGGKTGIWWGEFHKTGTAWGTYQNGVYSPSDTTWRFMPSIAQDTNGNTMLGYSA
ncbi:MAG TPA: hypothetical protein PLS53_14855, partial [Thermoanaerobaculaceae bacterium]|nr:hypothetical protein [Thermoanaerobaculaceae bacterium]